MLQKAKLAAALSTVLLAPLLGCSQGVPTTPSGVSSSLAGRASNQSAVVTLLPMAMGTVRQLPEMNIVDVASVSGDAQSVYFRTTETNREFRRGFAEFSVPSFPEVMGARIALHETRAIVSAEVAPDRHELSSYTEVDLAVTPGDFDRATSSLGTFESDANLDHQAFDFDVSSLVSAGALLGFRLKLEVDANEVGFDNHGTAFAQGSTPAGVTLEVVTTAAAAAGYLEEVIHQADLPEDVAAGLLAPVERARQLLTDDNPSNDAGACGQLGAFVHQVDTLEQGRTISNFSAWYFRQLATDLQSGLACSSGS